MERENSWERRFCATIRIFPVQVSVHHAFQRGIIFDISSSPLSSLYSAETYSWKDEVSTSMPQLVSPSRLCTKRSPPPFFLSKEAYHGSTPLLMYLRPNEGTGVGASQHEWHPCDRHGAGFDRILADEFVERMQLGERSGKIRKGRKGRQIHGSKPSSQMPLTAQPRS